MLRILWSELTTEGSSRFSGRQGMNSEQFTTVLKPRANSFTVKSNELLFLVCWPEALGTSTTSMGVYTVFDALRNFKKLWPPKKCLKKRSVYTRREGGGSGDPQKP